MNGEDSVSEEFGEELSESSKDFLRGCAPRIPPTGPPATAAADQPPPDEVIEAAGEAVRRYEGAMQSVVKGGYRPSAEELAWVEYRRSLVEGVSPQDLTWLKTKVYCRVLSMLRGEELVQQPDQGEGHPATPPPFQAAGPRPDRGASSADVSSSETSEWAPGWGSVRYEQPAAAQWRAHVASVLGPLLAAQSGQPPSLAQQQPSSLSPVAIEAVLGRMPAVAAASGATRHGEAPAGGQGQGQGGVVVAGESGRLTEYRDDYVDEHDLSLRLRRQRQHVTAAFALSFGVGLGFCVFRLLRSMRRRGRGNGDGRPTTPMPQ